MSTGLRDAVHTVSQGRARGHLVSPPRSPPLPSPWPTRHLRCIDVVLLATVTYGCDAGKVLDDTFRVHSLPCPRFSAGGNRDPSEPRFPPSSMRSSALHPPLSESQPANPPPPGPSSLQSLPSTVGHSGTPRRAQFLAVSSLNLSSPPHHSQESAWVPPQAHGPLWVDGVCSRDED